jgi:hypothetical protein
VAAQDWNPTVSKAATRDGRKWVNRRPMVNYIILPVNAALSVQSRPSCSVLRPILTQKLMAAADSEPTSKSCLGCPQRHNLPTVPAPPFALGPFLWPPSIHPAALSSSGAHMPVRPSFAMLARCFQIVASETILGFIHRKIGKPVAAQHRDPLDSHHHI